MAEEPGSWSPNDRGYVNKRNRAIVRKLPSVISDKSPCDPHHYPETQAGLAGEGLLEMVPLTREEHDLAHSGDAWTLSFLDANAPAYFRRIYMAYANTGTYLGPSERVAAVRQEVIKETEQRRRALGVY